MATRSIRYTELQSEDNRISKILEAIRQSPEHEEFCKNYKLLARNLGLWNHSLIEVNFEIFEQLTFNYSPYEKIKFLLEEFILNFESGVNNEALFLAIEQMGFIDINIRLQNYICANSLKTANNKVSGQIKKLTCPQNITASFCYEVDQQYLNTNHSSSKAIEETQQDSTSGNKAKNINDDQKVASINQTHCRANKMTRQLGLGFSLTLNLIFLSLILFGYYMSITNQGGNNKEVRKLQAMDFPRGGLGYIAFQSAETSLNIVAHSYNEYQILVRDIKAHVTLNLTIVANLRQKHLWPKDAPLLRADQIKKLIVSGNLEEMALLSVLGQLDNLDYVGLEYYETSNEELEERFIEAQDIETRPKASIVLKSLKIVSIYNVSRDMKLLSLFNLINTPVLEKIELTNGAVNHENVVLFCHFMAIRKQTLQKLYIKNVSWEADCSETEIVFPNLKVIIFETTSDAILSTKFVGENFCQLFPNLLLFSAKNNLISYNAFLAVLECSKLSKIDVGFEVPQQNTLFKLTALRNAYPALKSVKLLLFFKNKRLSDPCYVEGASREEKRFESFSVGTNCRIVHV